MMNIAFLNSIEKETYGGMEEWIRLVAHGLSMRSHNVYLIGRPDSEYIRRGMAGVGSVEKIELDISGDFNPLIIKKLKKFLNENSIDILTVNFNKDIRIGGIAARLDKNVKVVWSVGLDITKDKLAHKILTPMLVDKVITPSQSLKNEITKFGYIEKDIVKVIPIGIDEKVFDSKESSRQKLLEKYKLHDDAIVSVTSGRLVEQKGHEFLVEAASDIVKKYPEIRFIFLGDGQLEQFLKDKIKALNLEQYFIFAGMQDSIDLELAGADIMIHPSRKEPFGIAILEGMRASLPVVASRVGGIPEVVKENETAMLVKMGDTKALAEAVISLLGNKEAMLKMGEQGMNRFKQYFKVDSMIEQIEKFYLELYSSKAVVK